MAPRSKEPLADDPHRCRPISLTLPNALIDRVDRIVARNLSRNKKTNRSDIVRRILAQFFKSKEFTKLLTSGRRPVKDGADVPSE